MLLSALLKHSFRSPRIYLSNGQPPLTCTRLHSNLQRLLLSCDTLVGSMDNSAGTNGRLGHGLHGHAYGSEVTPDRCIPKYVIVHRCGEEQFSVNGSIHQSHRYRDKDVGKRIAEGVAKHTTRDNNSVVLPLSDLFRLVLPKRIVHAGCQGVGFQNEWDNTHAYRRFTYCQPLCSSARGIGR